ncbi:hypothetical protein GCM10009716_05580 [Streptomyces sodiiphilus]|uniref:M23ase beta-sheet core domain-containing protein n=1 Tax=Streptomyces sodiiphilus TaxID=226217 RepID=A0ABN2NTD1_9ACTN
MRVTPLLLVPALLLAREAPERAWPVPSTTGGVRPVVARLWEPPPERWLAGHRGVDLATRPRARVRAAAPGRVVFAGQVAGKGVLTIELDGPGTPPLRTTYEPVRPSAAPGDTVAAGDVVGVLADGPFHCPGPCLHWGLLRGRHYLDPLGLLPPHLLKAGPSRLLPLGGPPPATAARPSRPAAARSGPRPPGRRRAGRRLRR